MSATAISPFTTIHLALTVATVIAVLEAGGHTPFARVANATYRRERGGSDHRP